MNEPRTAKWYMEHINDTLDVLKEATSISQSAELHAHIGRLLSAAVQISGYSFKIIAVKKPQPVEVTEDFYCSTCYYQQRGIPCKPEDGALVGPCPRCDERKTFIHGSPPKGRTS